MHEGEQRRGDTKGGEVALQGEKHELERCTSALRLGRFGKPLGEESEVDAAAEVAADGAVETADAQPPFSARYHHGIYSASSCHHEQRYSPHRKKNP